MDRTILLLLVAGTAALSGCAAYYVPGTYPQEFFANAQISGAWRTACATSCPGQLRPVMARGSEQTCQACRVAVLLCCTCSGCDSSGGSWRPAAAAHAVLRWRCCTRRMPAAQVNSLTSFETDIPFEYYSMPFCKPPEGVHRAGNAANLGTALMGIKLLNSQYNFTVMVRWRESVCGGVAGGGGRRQHTQSCTHQPAAAPAAAQGSDSSCWSGGCSGRRRTQPTHMTGHPPTSCPAAVCLCPTQKQEVGRNACLPKGSYGPLSRDDVKVGAWRGGAAQHSTAHTCLHMAWWATDDTWGACDSRDTWGACTSRARSTHQLRLPRLWRSVCPPGTHVAPFASLVHSPRPPRRADTHHPAAPCVAPRRS
jgi:hypothetical protein